MKIEIPLHIRSTRYTGISKPNLTSLVELPQILSQEEEEAYQRTTDIKDMDLVSQVHNGAGKRMIIKVAIWYLYTSVLLMKHYY